jgi:hypothetical protein
VKQKSKKNNRVVAYLDGEGALPATEKQMKKWIRIYLPAKDKPQKKNKVSWFH